MRFLGVVALCTAVLAASAGCQTLETDFVREVRGNRGALLAGYPLKDQWRLFKYGNQVIHPPMIELASVLARGGEPMLRLILDSLESTDNDLDYRDALQVFQSMEWSGNYGICADKQVLAKIQRYQERIADPGWRDVYANMLTYLCRPKTQ